jgi:hypothetical protein
MIRQSEIHVNTGLTRKFLLDQAYPSYCKRMRNETRNRLFHNTFLADTRFIPRLLFVFSVF